MEATYRVFYEVEFIVTLSGKDKKELNQMADDVMFEIKSKNNIKNINIEHMGWDEVDVIRQATIYWKDGSKEIVEARTLMEVHKKYIYPASERGKGVQVIMAGNNDDYSWDADFNVWRKKQ